MIIHNPILTGSFTVNGTDVASITGSAASLTSLNSYTASQNNRNGTYTLTSSFAAQTASFTAFTSSVNTFTASQLVLNGTYATTGSNTFAGIQTVNSNLVVTGSITAQTLVVQTITSSVDFVTGSTQFGSLLTNTHVFSGSVSMNPNGLFVSSSGNVGIGTSSPTDFGSTYSVLCIDNTGQGGVLDLRRNGVRGLTLAVDGSVASIASRVDGQPLVFNANSGGTVSEKMRITSGGIVGIGTSSPLPPASRGGLVVRGNSNGAEIIIQNTDTTDGSAFGLGLVMTNNGGGTNSGDATIFLRNNGAMAFGTNNTERLRITSGGIVGVGNTAPSGHFEIGSAGFSNSTVYGGHLFTELRIAQGTWTTFANVTNNSWAGITELNWVGTIDYNRSGAAYMRWAYESGAAALGVVYTLFNNSQNATATFRNSGGALQINISGGTADYYVQVRVQGSRAS